MQPHNTYFILRIDGLSLLPTYTFRVIPSILSKVKISSYVLLSFKHRNDRFTCYVGKSPLIMLFRYASPQFYHSFEQNTISISFPFNYAPSLYTGIIKGYHFFLKYKSAMLLCICLNFCNRQAFSLDFKSRCPKLHCALFLCMQILHSLSQFFYLKSFQLK